MDRALDRLKIPGSIPTSDHMKRQAIFSSCTASVRPVIMGVWHNRKKKQKGVCSNARGVNCSLLNSPEIWTTNMTINMYIYKHFHLKLLVPVKYIWMTSSLRLLEP